MSEHPIDMIEPSAVLNTALLPTDLMGDPALRIQLSIAISLKRLADALAGKEDGSTISWLGLIADRMPTQ